MNPGLERKNDDDFLDVTNRIKAAITKIEASPRLKATQFVLCELANCSRGTINNRKWPLAELKRIKEARKAPKKSLETESPKAERELDLVKRLEEQLNDIRDEVIVWKNKHDALHELYEAQLNITRVLTKKTEGLKAEIVRHQNSTREENVVDIKRTAPSRKRT